LVAGQDDKVLNLCAAVGAVVCTVVAEEGSVAEEEETGVGV
jgi:hypothetical protein